MGCGRVNDQKVLNIKVLMAIALLKLALEKNSTATALLEEVVVCLLKENKKL
jgi:hypothetical protein